VPVVAAIVAAVPAGSSAVAKPPPNIIVIQTDDQDAGTLTREIMPETTKLLQERGTRFTDYIVSAPLCCPSRAELLTGQYPHNNGVMWNNPNPYGDLREKANILPVWLHRAGYQTAHVGRFLNFYARAVPDADHVPPGWDEWHTVLDPVDYYGYELHENGHSVYHWARDRDYLTKVLNSRAVRIIHRYVPGRPPLFMMVDQLAPHGGHRGYRDGECLPGMPIPAPQDIDLFQDKRLPKTPSFNEADVSDKPSFVRAHGPFRPEGLERLAQHYPCRLAALRAVDRGVARIVEALKRQHELADTAIIFTSDNGWLQGEHRVAFAKVNPYEEALHVPFVIRLPRDMRPRGIVPRRVSSTVANVDIAPTILALADARSCSRPGHCRTMDGRSMLKAIRSEGRQWPKHRGILLELQTSRPRAEPFTPCDYEGIRTSNQVYVEYHSATHAQEHECVPQEEREHYELRSDPFQLDNLFPAPPDTEEAEQEAALAARLADLRNCAGIKQRDPTPTSGHYCE
jgi:N-acetylglucosamine-6-sulfatase